MGNLCGVLEDDLDEVTEGGIDDVGSKGEVADGGSGVVGDEVVLEDLVAHTVVLSEFQWGFAVNVGDTVKSVAEFSTGPAEGVNELDGASDVDLAVVVRSLRVGPGGAGGQVPAEGSELVERPGPAFGCWGKLRGGGAHTVGVTEDAGGAEGLLGEARGGDHVVVLGLLVGGHEDGEALSDVDVEGVVLVLNNV